MLPPLPRDIWTHIALCLLPSTTDPSPIPKDDVLECVEWVFNLVCACSDLSQSDEILWEKCEDEVRRSFVLLDTVVTWDAPAGPAASRRQRLQSLVGKRLRLKIREGAGRTSPSGLTVETRRNGMFYADIRLPHMVAGDELQLLLHLSDADEGQFIHDFGIRAPDVSIRELDKQAQSKTELAMRCNRFASFLDDVAVNGDPMDMMNLCGLIKVTVTAERAPRSDGGRRSARLQQRPTETRVKCVAQRFETYVEGGRPVLRPHDEWGPVEFGWIPANSEPLLWVSLFVKNATATILPAAHLESMQARMDVLYQEATRQAAAAAEGQALVGAGLDDQAAAEEHDAAAPTEQLHDAAMEQ